MMHRHINGSEWTLAAIDSVLERGDLPDWRELFDAIRVSRGLGEKVLQVASRHYLGGTSVLAIELTRHIWPDLPLPEIIQR